MSILYYGFKHFAVEKLSTCYMHLHHAAVTDTEFGDDAREIETLLVKKSVRHFRH